MKQQISIVSTSVLSIALVAAVTTLAGQVTVTVPASTDAKLYEAIASGYLTGGTTYEDLLAADDLVVNGAGRLIIDKDLASAGYTGEVHVVAGSTLRLTVSGALGDTAHGTFVADGATLETLADCAVDTLNFLGEPLSFAGTGVDGEGALVSLSTNQQRRASWGGTILTMTGDALVSLKGQNSVNIDFPYQNADAKSSLDMNGHTLTFCGPYSSGLGVRTLPIRLNITNPGHIVASNGVYISVNNANDFGGDASNTFTIRGSNTQIDLYQAINAGTKKWTLVFAPEVRRNALTSTSGGGRWDGPIVWQNNTGASPFIAGKTTAAGGDITFAGPFATDTGMEVTNTTDAANYNLYPKPRLLFAVQGNHIGGTLKASDMPVEFTETCPSIGGIEIVNAKVSVGRHGIAGLWKGINQDYLSWNDTSAPSATRCREDFINNYRSSDPAQWVCFTNSVAYGPDDAMNATKPNYGKTTLVTYSGYLWNTNGNIVITFLTHVNACVRVAVEREANIWNGLQVVDINAASNPTGIRLKSNGAYKIAIVLALNNGVGGANTALSGDYGIMYCLGGSTSSSTNPADYMPLMDPGDGSLFTRMLPDSDEYNALGIYGTEPVKLADSLTGSGGATLELSGGNYSVGNVAGLLTVINSAKPHTQNALFTVTDELACKAADLLAGEHLVVTGALKFAEGSTLSLSGAQVFPDHGTHVAAESTEAISGAPAATSDRPSRLKVKAYVSPVDGKKLMVDVAVKALTLSFR